MRRKRERQQLRPNPTAASNVPASVDLAVWAETLVAELVTELGIGLSSAMAATLQQQAIAVRCPMPPTVQPPKPDPTKPLIVRDEQSLAQVSEAIAESTGVAIDIETSSLDHRQGVIVGIGLAVCEQTYYLPINHRIEDLHSLRPDQLPLAQVLDVLRLPERPLVAHNAKFELKWLRHHGVINCNFIWDTMLAARLMRSDLSADLEVVAVRELDVPGWSLPASEMRRMQFLPIELVANYCAKDCWYTLELYRKQKSCLS